MILVVLIDIHAYRCLALYATVKSNTCRFFVSAAGSFCLVHKGLKMLDDTR